MRHLVSGRKLKRTSSHRKALLANLATELLRHKSIKTTEAKAKELRPYVEAIITRAKNALLREKQGLLPEKQTMDVHSRRVVGRVIRVKDVLQELFDSIAPAVIDRNGGYTRVIKTGFRKGDASKTAIIELVDFSAPQDGSYAIKKKKKAVKTTESKPKAAKEANPKKEEKVVETVEEMATPVIVDEVIEVAEESVTIVDSTVEETVAETVNTDEVAEESAPTNDNEAAEENKA